MTTRDPLAARLAAVSQRYGAVAALDDVSLDIPGERMIGLIGPDGVGKSTMLSIVAGVRKLQGGRIETLGGDMKDPVHRKACYHRIAYMPQGLGRNLYPTLSVFENLDFFAKLFGQDRRERRRRITELLEATGLAPFPDRPAGKLSGGMKQKLGLCCALIHDPDLLILDEPTTGVDPLSRLQFWELIERIRDRRPTMTVIVATAYMEEAERFDWLAAMDDGKIIATGSPEEIRTQADAPTLEAAFINLLPEHKRAGHEAIVVPPRPEYDGGSAISATGLTKRFGDFTAVDHVSFEIARGEIFGFLGSNGCGKTTTMKMLTGLLPATEGEAKLFGQTLNARDMETRRRVGYVSQSFSLYGELTVQQNLELHGHLFQLAPNRLEARVAEMMDRFDLTDFANMYPSGLPLGIRQRLQLAAAVIHGPEMLILDEPTSGVDPIARDGFWRFLIELSRKDGVTIFISTHFMDEAERCDRISLMHAGKVLADGTPKELIAGRGAQTLEETFIAYLREGSEDIAPPQAVSDTRAENAPETGLQTDHNIKPANALFSARRVRAYASRETLEILRDPIRLAFALIGPLILMITFGYGISFDIEKLKYATLDLDRTLESRQILENFSGSRYFDEQRTIADVEEMDRLLRSGEITFAIEVPSGFGKSLVKDDRTEINVLVDGAMPFRAETARGYITGVARSHLEERGREGLGQAMASQTASVETRFRYNQAFKSTHAITPGVIMLLCILIPAMMTAVGVVREKEMGSITNFHATPVTRVEFLLGKQLPYVAIAFVSLISLVLMVLFVFGVPIKGSVPAFLVGGLLYVWATTGYGVLVSAFMKTQIAAIFATAILAMVPTMNFSGFLTPVSTLGGGARFIGGFFPPPYFQQISVGSFTKALGFSELWVNHLALIGFSLAFFTAAALLLKKQET